MENKVFVSLCGGRHETPANVHVFDKIEDVNNFSALEKRALAFIENAIGIETVSGFGINQASLEDAQVFHGKAELNLYVTGLTAATAAVIKVCALNGVSLVLWHYNRESGEYVPQRIF